MFLVGVKKGVSDFLPHPAPPRFYKTFTLRDALKAGELFEEDVPDSEGVHYREKLRRVMGKIPPNGNHHDLLRGDQKEYFSESFYNRCILKNKGEKLLKRSGWDSPSLTVLTNPISFYGNFCHPDEPRPFKTREAARIQTFPDDWSFSGSVKSVYKQIGNAVPVNLAYVMGLSMTRLLNAIGDLENGDGNPEAMWTWPAQ